MAVLAESIRRGARPLTFNRKGQNEQKLVKCSRNRVKGRKQGVPAALRMPWRGFGQETLSKDADPGPCQTHSLVNTAQTGLWPLLGVSVLEDCDGPASRRQRRQQRVAYF